MKRFTAIAALLIGAALATPVLAQGMPGGAGGYGGGAFGGGSLIKPRGPIGPGDPEGTAEELRVAGRCDKAVPIFRRIVEGPRGFPISQYNLGLCLLDLAAADHDAQHAAALRQEGAAWIVRAANGGFDKAQAKAVALYLDGIGLAADPVEAEKWALIFHRNGMRLALGLPDIDSDLRDRLDQLSDAQQDAAQARADAWTPPPVQ